MSEVPVWTCSFADGPEAKLSDLTVGAKFALSCRGDIPVEWDPKAAPPKITFAKEEDAYALTVLKTGKLEAQAAEFVVTAYKPGKHEPEYIRILQGDKGFEAVKPKWELKSVLKPDQKPQPFGPLGPFSVPLPIWVWVTAVLTLVVVALSVWRFVRRSRQRRRMLEDLKRHRTAMSPLHQFYRDARLLRRRLHTAKSEAEIKTIATDLEREFRLFVLRRFEVPALDWTDSEILRDVRKRHRKTYASASEPLRRALRELSRMRAQATPSVHDVEQLHRMSLDAAERVEGGK